MDKFTYLGSTISVSLNLDDELNSRIGKAATAFSKLGKRAWENKMLTIKTKVMIYKACVLSALLYGSESWTLYSNQEKKLNMFHMRCGLDMFAEWTHTASQDRSSTGNYLRAQDPKEDQN